MKQEKRDKLISYTRSHIADCKAFVDYVQRMHEGEKGLPIVSASHAVLIMEDGNVGHGEATGSGDIQALILTIAITICKEGSESDKKLLYAGIKDAAAFVREHIKE